MILIFSNSEIVLLELRLSKDFMVMKLWNEIFGFLWSLKFMVDYLEDSGCYDVIEMNMLFI